jgi:hypothetical protein
VDSDAASLYEEEAEELPRQLEAAADVFSQQT